MGSIPFIEWVGYAASIMIAVSMFMKNVAKLRMINLIGSVLFSIYGYTIGAYPVAIVNTIIVFVNLYYLFTYKKAAAES